VRINAVVPPYSWDPVYLVNSRATWLTDYTNAVQKGEFVYPDQSLHYLLGAVGQTTIAMVSSNSSASGVVLDDVGQLPKLPNITILSGASQGWYFDPGTSTLFVKYTASGLDTLRVLTAQAKTQTLTLPERFLVGAVILFVAVDLSLYVFVRLVWPSVKGGPRRPSNEIS